MYPNALDFLIMALASWRAAVFLVREDGPFFVARWLRERAGIQHDSESGAPVVVPENVLALALACVWCTSFWTSIIMLALWFSVWGVPVVLLMAVAGAAVVVEAIVGRLNTQ